MDTKSYVWIKKEEDKNKLSLKEEYNSSLRQWVIASFCFITIFFIYHIILVPNIQLIELLISGKKDIYNIHIAIKSILLIFIFLCFTNSTILTIIYLLREKMHKKNQNYFLPKTFKKLLIIFKGYFFFYYFTLILLIPAKNIQKYLKQVLISSKVCD